MKSERRHELQTNQLAEWLAHQIEHHRTQLRLALLLLLVAFVAVAVALVWSNWQSSGRGERWFEFFAAETAGGDSNRALESVAEEYPTSAPGVWALQSMADQELTTGTQTVIQDREGAVSALETARDTYQKVIEQAGRYPFLQQRARFGLAVSLESLNEWTQAKQAYDDVIQNGDPESAIVKLAKQRKATLEQEATRRFYKWFWSERETAELPADLETSPDFPGLNLQDLNLTPGDQPPATPPSDTTRPRPADETKPDEAKPDEAKPDEAKPDEAKPDEAKPDEAKPDEAKPDEAKPDEAKPAEDQPADEDG